MKHCNRLFLLCLFALGTATSVDAQNVNEAGEPFPVIPLPARANGRALETLLGTDLPTLARWYGHGEAEFRALIRREPALFADRTGHLHYVCVGTVVVNGAVAPGEPVPFLNPAPLAETFALHSRVGATKVIYLDFDGHTTSGTYWNSQFASGADIVTPRYDIDGSANGFSSQELSNVQEIWRRVAEDFAAFEVDVTTQDPGSEALRKTGSTDESFGVRVCIGGSSLTWFGAASGGVAYLGSFSWESDTPCFVFPEQLGNGHAKYVGEVVAHESGHTLGLHHDGATDGTEYYAGHGTWAPIMGVGYYRSLVQWSAGEYPLANNLEDDLAIIANMVAFRGDDVGNDILNATPLAAPTPATTGVIEQRSDSDVYSFVSGTGPVTFTVSTGSPSGNLYPMLSLYDGLGDLVPAISSTSLTGASLTADVSQGTYYVAIQGVGDGDPATTGYSNYASLGQYLLTGLVTPPASTAQSPVAVVSNSAPLSGGVPLTVSFSSEGSSDPDGSITAYDWDFGNGTTSTLPNPSHTYSVPGAYTASLVVYDNSGLSATATLVISVASSNVVYVADLAMTLIPGGKNKATAKLTIKDVNGNLKQNAKVFGYWSGLAPSSSKNATTNSTGTVTFTSASIDSKKPGVFTFTITAVTPPSGFTYDPALNVANQGSVSTP